MQISEEKIKSAGDLIDKIISQEEELKEAFASAHAGESIIGEMVTELKLLRADSSNAEENYKRLENLDILFNILILNVGAATMVGMDSPFLSLLSAIPLFPPLDDEKQ